MEDLPAILRLWREMMSFHTERDDYFVVGTKGAENFSDYLAENLGSDTMRLFVAQRGSDLVGYCLATEEQRPPVFDDRPYGCVCDLAVTVHSRRQGVGGQLIAAAEDWFRLRGLRRIEVRVAVCNEVSKPFWRKMGFEPFVETVRKQID